MLVTMQKPKHAKTTIFLQNWQKLKIAVIKQFKSLQSSACYYLMNNVLFNE